MRTAVIFRHPSSDEGTFGSFQLDDGWKCFSGELPWRDNEPNYSCVRAGDYSASWQYSSAHKMWLYKLSGVPDRSAVEIHVANFCGDILKGFRSDLRGCIALGNGLGELEGQMAVTGSKLAIAEFHKRMSQAPLQLVIHDP